MKDSIKKKWIAALRSGKYKQVTGILRNKDNGRCCLGVLCDVVNPKGWVKKNSKGVSVNKGLDMMVGDIEWSDEYPSLTIVKEAGLKPSTVEKLAKMNDEMYVNYSSGQRCHQHTFEDIAKYINRNL